MSNSKSLSMKQKIILAALDCCKSDLNASFTAEELLVAAWKRDKAAWGLRGFEELHPDSNKLYIYLDRRTEGMVDSGLLEKTQGRVYRLSEAGLALASATRPEDEILQVKTDRILHEAIKQILEHPVFQAWLKDPAQPKLFRQAGHFWGIAPGTPARTVRDRVHAIDQKLDAAMQTLRSKGVDQIVEQRGRLLFDKQDIERCMQFQATLKERFARELQILAPSSTQRPLVMTSPSRDVGKRRKAGNVRH